MAGQLDGKVAIVTGGASGIGRGTVELFVAEGAKVVIADLNGDWGATLAARLGANASFLRTDVSDRAQVQALVDHAVSHFGGLDIMFNNAGVPSIPVARFLDDELTDFEQVMAVNVKGVMLGSQIAGRMMRERGKGVIINTCSSAGIHPGVAILTYRASKAAVANFTKCLALDLAGYGIRVNAVAPGYIKTEMTAFTDPNLSAEQIAKAATAMEKPWMDAVPLRRAGLPEDIARAALYLVSDAAALVTGVVLPVDGAMTTGDPVNHLEAIMAAGGAALAG